METVTMKLYKFVCTRCHKKAVSVKEERALKGLCRTCRSLHIAPGQMAIVEGMDA